MQAQVTATIHEHIVSTWLNGDERGFDDDTDLNETGILDSFSTLALVAMLDETFKVQLDPTDINTETFRSVNTVAKLVLEKLAAQGTSATNG
jgi:acyl carrier protein